MELPEERVKMMAPKVRNLTQHKVKDIKIRTQTHNQHCRKDPSCELVLEIEGGARVDPRIDVILLPGELTDEIEHEGIEAALTSDWDHLRCVAVLMKEFAEKKIRSRRPKSSKNPPRRIPKQEDDLDFDFDEEDLSDES